MLTTTYQTDAFASRMTTSFIKGPRQSEYLSVVEKSTNPNVGPGSYDPVVKPKLNQTINTDWARGSERFRSVSVKASLSPNVAGRNGKQQSTLH